MKIRKSWLALVTLLLISSDAEARHFRAGFAKQDITPAKATPMWGYGARHAALSVGIRDPLYAKAVVIDVGDEKLAIVGLDLGRSPTEPMMIRIREAIKTTSGIGLILMSGSHTHHGPVIELLDEPGKGQGVFDDAIKYTSELEAKIIAAINAAAADVKDAKIGWGAKQVAMNRNRHSKIEPKPVDRELGVMRLDDVSGKPIAIIVNYAAHPTMLDAADLRFSAEWPGAMMTAVEKQFNSNCLFMQGASGDLSVMADEQTRGIEAFGKAMAVHVTEVAESITPEVPARPRLKGVENTFEFTTRLSFANPVTPLMFSAAFFPELANASMSEDLLKNTIHPHLTTVIINQELALVGGSGEFFCEHSLRLKDRSRAAETFFFGYCNGHHMYFPTIEAAAEGGYGADPAVSWVSPGAGEEMMDEGLINIYTMLGKFTSVTPAKR
ncbi:MAG: neutral/alkaline non-lysosomal ceramidase N-terminal domain-containing protein [Planctomycetaceae bacterium]|nr:neutral/alkaline non-lysosomal ceramidase N-terminal domain-containing protein [Planctomycetaceae bacterium]